MRDSALMLVLTRRVSRFVRLDFDARQIRFQARHQRDAAAIDALVAGLEAYLARIEIKSDETRHAPGKD